MTQPDRPPNNKPDPNLVKLDPATLVFIILALLFIPLVLAGFISQ